jgi:hypothetical protein
MVKGIYVSTDVETDGTIPEPHLMLSLGSAAYLSDKVLVDAFSANLELLPSAISLKPSNAVISGLGIAIHLAAGR